MNTQPLQKANPRNKLQTANKPSDLNIFLLNIQRELQCKLDKLTLEVNKINPHILIITEHGMTTEQLYALNLEGFILATVFCRSIHRWGGVAIFIRDNKSLQHSEINTKDYSLEQTAELAAIELKRDNLIIIGAYRSLQTKIDGFMQILDGFLANYPNKNKKILLLRDLNINISSTKDPNTLKLKIFVREHNLDLEIHLLQE